MTLNLPSKAPSKKWGPALEAMIAPPPMLIEAGNCGQTSPIIKPNLQHPRSTKSSELQHQDEDPIKQSSAAPCFAPEVPVANAEAAAQSVENGVGSVATSQHYAIVCGRKIFQMIGHGAYGQVYEAQNMCTGKKEVVKTVPKSDQAYMEASILCELPPHDHVIQQYHFKSSSRTIYMFLQFGGSKNLHEVLLQQKCFRFELATAMELFLSIVQAILHIHKHGVCHLDIKPENLMQGDDEIIRLADFGAAQYTKHQIAHPCGSLPFAAPEVLDAFKNKVMYWGSMADTFSMGVLLFEMAFGVDSMSMQLGWKDRPQLDLLRDPNQRASEMRHLLFNRSAICTKMMTSFIDPDQKAGGCHPEVILSALNSMLDPVAASRVPLDELFNLHQMRQQLMISPTVPDQTSGK
eukprot:gnl/MRDRNA2_/MRDRNA2_83398_c0_seq1.p1 gnl/MRDRNA2_/MRDRNA2_83398_c0~~gnl/MRDRNA2_/MRDRNA2_83398_c0_seq1.p1  ORF type:complete len:406 (+),score=73.92 gnl/MRDRNA2_/MRDRNA2_83398_c0_seq1:85-1302(+)